MYKFRVMYTFSRLYKLLVECWLMRGNMRAKWKVKYLLSCRRLSAGFLKICLVAHEKCLVEKLTSILTMMRKQIVTYNTFGNDQWARKSCGILTSLWKIFEYSTESWQFMYFRFCVKLGLAFNKWWYGPMMSWKNTQLEQI
jgi:hypothetical protein